MTILASPTPAGAPPPSKEATHWLDEIQGVEQWDAQKMENFIEFLDSAPNRDRHALFGGQAVNEAAISALHKIDADLFETLIDIYCHWTTNTYLDWGFCDVVIRRLESAFERAEVGGRAQIAIAAAEMADSHNRWFVMRRVMSICDPSLDENTASRIAIEIAVKPQAASSFARCAEVLGRQISEYHPKILAAVEKVQKTT